ncbi:nuclear factor 7, brain [Betta splendens]|uniref:Nuclear factor 7, brain n=1 Tax=Betta splendens TaxID=158456 RepID=A0A6P7NAW8_BETSP|nr:nuclear factor 7, brain [Betta splendens]
MSIPEEDLTCPVCCDIFGDPVLLPCSHSFCRACLKRCWDSGLRECPVCRKRASKCSPPSNLALRNVCEAHLQLRRRSSAPEDAAAAAAAACDLHGERMKLFCLADRQPICVVCQSSRLHKGHECSPAEEAALDCKEELTRSLGSLQDKVDRLTRIEMSSAHMFEHIQRQTLEAQQFIKGQFLQLHQALQREESARLAAVQKEAEEKTAAMREKIREVSAEVLSLTETISIIQEQLEKDDMHLLQTFKATQDRCKSLALGSDNMSGLLVDVSKHVCNLKYAVWEKLLDHVDFTPVTLDPNTAHPCLVLCDRLTSLRYSKQPGRCPDNGERFHMSAEVVAMTALGSGSHRWAVETGSNRDWLLGVAALSVPRNAVVAARPENGYWTLCFRDGEFRAMTSPPTPLTLPRAPERIEVQLDYNRGTVSFVDPLDNTVIYAFTHTFTEALLPYFYTQSSHPLKIMPQKVLVTMLRQ